MYLDKLKVRFAVLGLASPDELLPCSEDEVKQIEKQRGIVLPSAYKEFLLWMGHGAGRFLRGTDCFYQHLPDLQEWANELLDENAFQQPLPMAAFVFYMHQGYQFSFFRLTEGDDPPIYFYGEWIEQQTFTQTHQHYSDFLAQVIEDHAQLNTR